jgi:hypothetical protein
MKISLCAVALMLVGAFVVACSGGGSGATPPSPTQMPTQSPPAQPSPASIATSAPLGNGSALSSQPVAQPIPAPSGYTASISAPLVSAPANATIAIAGGTIAPASLPALQSNRRRAPQSTGSFNAIYYDTLTPSANITVAGDLTFTQSFPGGGLTVGTAYYLGFYDTTAASPAWQTIAGPVTSSGANLTFTGTTGAITLQANKLYGFAIFSTVSPSGTPPAAPQTLLYIGNKSGVTIMTASGTVVTTLNIPNSYFDLDDAGNIYVSNAVSGIQKSLAMYPAGSTTAAATYTPSSGNLGPLVILASGAGEVAAADFSQGNGVQTVDVWDPGKSGSPSRTLTTKTNETTPGFILAHDGTLYIPDTAPNGAPQFDVFSPGASTPTTTIIDTVVPPSQYANFSPNYTAIGPDGTLYVTEYSFFQPDPNAGLYIYPGLLNQNRAETFVSLPSNANGAGPEGVDVDASGNIYVVNNNAAYVANGSSISCQTTTLASVTVYSPAGQLERTITGPFTPYPITVAADGTAFFSSFGFNSGEGPCPTNGVNGTFSIAPGASTATQLSTVGSSEVVLFDGTHKTVPDRVGHSVGGMGALVIRRRAP